MMAGVSGPSVKIALGTGKSAITRASIEPLAEITAKLKQLPKDISLKYQARALQKAAKPGMDALRSEVSQLNSVTGNLLASVSKVTRKYTNNKRGVPVGVVVVGFRRPTNAQSQKTATPAFAGGSVLKGPNRAYHSHLVEYGTRQRIPGFKTRNKRRGRFLLGGRIRTKYERRTVMSGNKTGILSSLSGRGPFKQKGRGKYPIDFISTGPVRGTTGQFPLTKAYRRSVSKMQSVLDVEMRKALEAALRELGGE